MPNSDRRSGRLPALTGQWGKRDRYGVGEGSVWPDEAQVLLLKAALSKGTDALAAWNGWLNLADLDAVDPSSHQILPLVHRNLAGQAISEAASDKLKRHYMVAWAKNQRLFRLLSQTLTQLQARGIDTLVLKGAALAPLYYADEGTRGMGDFDVLVPDDRFSEACGVLGQHGWRPLYYHPALFDTRFEHAIAFLDKGGDSVDLHCHVLIDSCERCADDDFWEASRPFEVLGTATRTLCDTDHLLQACAHGLTWVKVPPVRWVADAMTILRVAGASIDWDRLVEQAVERGVALKVLATSDYLRSTFGAEIPGEVSASLRRAPATWIDKRQYETWTQNKRGKPVSLLEYHWTMYRRGVKSEAVAARLKAIPQYLRFWAQTEQLWSIPVGLTVKAWRVVGHRLGFYQYWDGT